MKKFWLTILAVGLLSFNALGQTPSIGPSGSNIAYSAGTISAQGFIQSITAGGVSGPFTANENNCSASAIAAGIDACEYVYWATGTGLSVGSSFCSAMPYVLATFTTDSIGNPLVVSAFNPPPALSLFESQNLCGSVTTFQVATSSATPTFNPNLASIMYMALTSNVTSMTISPAPVGKWIWISFGQPATGGPYTVTWASNMHWPAGTTALGLSPGGGSPLAVSTGAGTISGAHCYYAGSVAGWYCMDTWWGLK